MNTLPLVYALLLGLITIGLGQESRPEADFTPAELMRATPKGTPLENVFIWGGLVQATNKELKAEISDKEKALAEKLRNASFEYRNFDLISEHTQPIFLNHDTFLIPSDELFLIVDYNGEANGGLNLRMQLWRRQDILVKTNVILRPDSPVFITGPKWGDDQLIFVVELLRGAKG